MATDAEAERFDGVLLNIAQQSGSIDSILDMFFGFMQRKTDFFTGAQDEAAAEALVLKYYKKHWKVGQKRRTEMAEKNRIADEERKKRADDKRKKDEEEYNRQQKEMKAKQDESPACVEVDDEEADKIKAEKAAKKAGDGKAEAKKDAKKDEKKDDEKKEAKKDAKKDEKKDDEKKEDGDKSDDEKDNKEPPPPGNGGKTDKYWWTQTLQALEVHVPVKPGVKAKQIVCDIGVDTIKLGVKGEELILNGKLGSKVKPDDCMWTLVDNKIVQITMEKFDGMKWWNSVMEGDASIDTKKIVPENSKLSDLDGETRMTVEKMMYDQRQKALGKPTSDQEKQHDLLEKFKMAHPEMDFSKAKVNYGGGGMGGGGMNFGQ